MVTTLQLRLTTSLLLLHLTTPRPTQPSLPLPTLHPPVLLLWLLPLTTLSLLLTKVLRLRLPMTTLHPPVTPFRLLPTLLLATMSLLTSLLLLFSMTRPLLLRLTVAFPLLTMVYPLKTPLLLLPLMPPLL